jgi:hypothetical protein
MACCTSCRRLLPFRAVCGGGVLGLQGSGAGRIACAWHAAREIPELRAFASTPGMPTRESEHPPQTRTRTTWNQNISAIMSSNASKWCGEGRLRTPNENRKSCFFLCLEFRFSEQNGEIQPEKVTRKIAGKKSALSTTYISGGEGGIILLVFPQLFCFLSLHS